MQTSEYRQSVPREGRQLNASVHRTTAPRRLLQDVIQQGGGQRVPRRAKCTSHGHQHHGNGSHPTPTSKASLKVTGISQVDKHGPFRCMVHSNRGRDTGRNTRRAVGSWSHQEPWPTVTGWSQHRQRKTLGTGKAIGGRAALQRPTSRAIHPFRVCTQHSQSRGGRARLIPRRERVMQRRATGKREFNRPWHEPGPPNHDDDKVGEEGPVPRCGR